MRKIGDRIKETRVKFRVGLQKKFLKEIKKISGLNWTELANKLNLSRHTLTFDLREEKSTMPLSIMTRLLEDYPFQNVEKIEKDWIKEILEKNWGQKLEGEKNKKILNIPKESQDLSEIFGVILGDGHLERKTLTITGNSNEIEHYNYLSKKFNYLFKLNTKIFKIKKQNSIQLKIYSTELIRFLLKNNFVLGNKIKNKASLPRWIFDKEEYIYGALRGLLDTDGGVYQKQKKYKRAIIEFQIKSPYIRKDIFEMLRKIGFSPSKSSVNVRIQSQDEVKRFLATVGCSNPKNIVRTKHFIKNGEIPLKDKLNSEILSIKVNKPFKASLV